MLRYRCAYHAQLNEIKKKKVRQTQRKTTVTPQTLDAVVPCDPATQDKGWASSATTTITATFSRVYHVLSAVSVPHPTRHMHHLFGSFQKLEALSSVMNSVPKATHLVGK